MFPVYDIAYSVMDMEAWADSKSPLSYILRLAVRVSFVLGCFVVCYIAPSFNGFIGFVGSFMMISLGIIIPPVAYLYEFSATISQRKKVMIWLLLALNGCIWVVATYHSSLELFKEK